MISDLETYLTEKLSEMTESKKQTNVEPYWPTKAEFFTAVDKDVRKVLNNLFHEKKLKVHKTIHAPLNDFVELVKED